MEQAFTKLNTLMPVEQAFNEAFNSASHMVSDHLMVGDFHGFLKGIIDYFIDQSALFMFHYVFLTCYLYTIGFTLLFDDGGVSFYRCYKNFPAKVVFY